jgi:hypothetical protein
MTWEELKEKAIKLGYKVEENCVSEYLCRYDNPIFFFDTNDVQFGESLIDSYVKSDLSYDQMYQIMLALED